MPDLGCANIWEKAESLYTIIEAQFEEFNRLDAVLNQRNTSRHRLRLLLYLSSLIDVCSELSYNRSIDEHQLCSSQVAKFSQDANNMLNVDEIIDNYVHLSDACLQRTRQIILTSTCALRESDMQHFRNNHKYSIQSPCETQSQIHTSYSYPINLSHQSCDAMRPLISCLEALIRKYSSNIFDLFLPYFSSKKQFNRIVGGIEAKHYLLDLLLTFRHHLHRRVNSALQVIF